MVHVFISYSHEDKNFAQKLKQQIEDAGFDNWIDAERLGAGAIWPEEIYGAIESAYALIVIKSPHSYPSVFVTGEWMYARGKDVRVIPLLYEQQPETNPMLEDIQHLDFTNSATQPWDKLFQVLGETRDEYGVKVRIPKGASPKVRAGLKKLNSEFVAEVVEAAEHLGNLQDSIAVPGLIVTLGHEGNPAMGAAFHALIKIGESAVPQLLKEFVNQDRGICFSIANVLSQIKSETAFLGLLDGVSNSRQDVRQASIYYLGRWKDQRALPSILEAINDTDNDVRREAISALVTIGDASIIPVLIEALRDHDKDIRISAASGLQSLGDITAVSALINALGDTEFYVRVYSARALGEIGDASVIEELVRLSGDQAGVRQAAIDALNAINKRTGSLEAIEATKKF